MKKSSFQINLEKEDFYLDVLNIIEKRMVTSTKPID